MSNKRSSAEDDAYENYTKEKLCEVCDSKDKLIDKHWKKNNELQNTIIEWKLHCDRLLKDNCRLRDELHTYTFTRDFNKGFSYKQ